MKCSLFCNNVHSFLCILQEWSLALTIANQMFRLIRVQTTVISSRQCFYFDHVDSWVLAKLIMRHSIVIGFVKLGHSITPDSFLFSLQISTPSQKQLCGFQYQRKQIHLDVKSTSPVWGPVICRFSENSKDQMPPLENDSRSNQLHVETMHLPKGAFSNTLGIFATSGKSRAVYTYSNSSS